MCLWMKWSNSKLRMMVSRNPKMLSNLNKAKNLNKECFSDRSNRGDSSATDLLMVRLSGIWKEMSTSYSEIKSLKSCNRSSRLKESFNWRKQVLCPTRQCFWCMTSETRGSSNLSIDWSWIGYKMNITNYSSDGTR